MTKPYLLTRSNSKAHSPIPPVILNQNVPEGYAAQQSARCTVVKDAQAVRPRLASVHEQVVQWPCLEPHILQGKKAFQA